MDYIASMVSDQKRELRDRLASYEENLLILSHNGEVPVINGFNVGRPTTVKDLVEMPRPTIAVLGDEQQLVAECIAKYAEVIGFNMVALNDVPGQILSHTVSSVISVLSDISYTRILNDIADEQLMKEHMTAFELENNAAKRELNLRKRSDGSIKELVDFDRSHEDTEE